MDKDLIKLYISFRENIFRIIQLKERNRPLTKYQKPFREIRKVLFSYETFPPQIKGKLQQLNTQMTIIKSLLDLFTTQHLSNEEFQKILNGENGIVFFDTFEQTKTTLLAEDKQIMQLLHIRKLNIDSLLGENREFADIAIVDTNFIAELRSHFLKGVKDEFVVEKTIDIMYPPQVLAEIKGKQTSFVSSSFIRKLCNQAPFVPNVVSFYQTNICNAWCETKKGKKEIKKRKSREEAINYFIKTADFAILHKAIEISMKQKIIILSTDTDFVQTIEVLKINLNHPGFLSNIRQIGISGKKLKLVA